MEISVKGLRVLITAAASGIGCAVAKRFLDNGARVFVCDINADQLDACATLLPGAGITRADVADASQVDRLFEEAAAYLGGLDVLVNNASMILFLCSQAGSKISGQALSVDGFTETLRG